ncbi:uncharacterized protein LOC126840006 [Adelges cooleyi]|uniref:uncharacterized protein LOC126840006 n=1 Tax=Adelges cooleyi TaxID=133065 RepID=UPI00217F7D76|nr:uncharacterized protein LOC126840006 [Adelges cooleyi]
MIQPLLFVYSLFSICPFLMCSAGNSGSWSDADNASTLNDILKAVGWKKLVTNALERELKSINGEGIDVSELLNKGADGNIVTPANYFDKLLKSSAAVNCFYSESIKFINDMFIEIIAGKCMIMGSSTSMLDCMERFWKTMDLNKSLIEKMLLILNFFHKASKGLGTTIVIDALESLLPNYDRQIYNKSNYLDANGTVKMDNFMWDYKYLLDKMNCANKLLWDFLVARCLPTCMSGNQKSDHILKIEAGISNLTLHQGIDKVFDFFVKNLIVYDQSFLIKLGFNKERLIV